MINIIIENMVANIISDNNYNIGMNNVIESSFQHILSSILKSSNDYNLDVRKNIESIDSYENILSDNLVSNFNYLDSFYLESNNQSINDIRNTIISENNYGNIISNDIISEFINIASMDVKSDNNYYTTIGRDVNSISEISNDLVGYVLSGLQVSNSILERNIVINNNMYNNYIEDNESIITTESVIVYIDNILVDIISFDISINDESYCYSVNVELALLNDWSKSYYGSLLDIFINGVEYNFIIDGRMRDRQFNSETYNVSGRTKTSILGEGALNNITKSWEGMFTSEIISEILNDNGIVYTNNLIDWYIPSGLLNSDNESPIDVIKKITEASGGIIICSPDGELTIKHKYDTCPLYYNSYVKLFSDYDNIFSVSESVEYSYRYNAVIVANIIDSSSYTYSISELDYDESNYIKKIKVTVYPFINKINLLTSYVSSDIMIVSGTNPITETINDEIVEVIEGKGSASDPVKNIITYEYLNTNLGTITFNNNNIETQIEGQSLLKITYKTEYHEFLVYNANEDIEEVQLYTTDENEVL